MTWSRAEQLETIQTDNQITEVWKAEIPQYLEHRKDFQGRY